MTEQQLLHTLQTVDSKYTAEVRERVAQAQASKQRSRRIGMKPILLTAGAAAACLCVSVAALMPKEPDLMTIANSDITEQLALDESEPAQERTDAAAVTTAPAETGEKSTEKTTADKFDERTVLSNDLQEEIRFDCVYLSVPHDPDRQHILKQAIDRTCIGSQPCVTFSLYNFIKHYFSSTLVPVFIR